MDRFRPSSTVQPILELPGNKELDIPMRRGVIVDKSTDTMEAIIHSYRSCEHIAIIPQMPSSHPSLVLSL